MTRQCAAGMPVPNSTGSHWRSKLDELDDLQSTEVLPETSDVVIIGGGYAGVATAYHLLVAGSAASITIVEARGLCSGATGRNGGHVRPDLYGHIPHYIERDGLDKGVELAEFEIANLAALKEVVQKENIDCDFRLTRVTDVWCNEESVAMVKGVYDAMVSHNLDYMNDVQVIAGEDTPGITGVTNAKVCATYTAATMSPYKFIMHLVHILRKRGVSIQAYTPVNLVRTTENGTHEVCTARGTIRAGKIVYATNAYTKALLPEYAGNIIPCKGICCHIAVPPGTSAPLLHTSFIVYEPGDPSVCSYLIQCPDGGIIVGGAKDIFRRYRNQWYDNTDDSCLIDSAKDYYQDFMQKNFRGWEGSGAAIKHMDRRHGILLRL
ncbi:hypothetical protein AAFC00_001887 [Neodothiora populina]|uniref:FAD dependent oxidoreductase domain-containing protein n=1 Tax=Neodothiora populina TaxID=2781224 RepID=A0ABR3PQJ2_9PEZI